MAKLGALVAFFPFLVAPFLARELPPVATHLNNATGDSHSKLKGEDNYFALVIYYTEGPLTLYVANSWLGYGKWVRGKNDFTEIGSPNGLTMTAWGEYHITASGRSWSPTGTEGSFDVYSSDGQRVLYVYWDVVYAGMGEWKRTVFDSRFQATATRIGESHLDVTLVIKSVAGEAIA
ncbi:uncharacterized protein LOC9632474 [Selaginella moellendorffii]|uniref:uncharacterized protein LOC9632474 n=1 Tax=Selaginella moellendorffii TaxID=88036 RepID=UPI000D1C65EA|nr:uncharacterized protein LOC9632474 [Selaginella moellendorffii]|eukprot:XP_024531060.1 uncharacterized protein LOC9632474 [Selaginella moellendorffii]